MYKFRVITQDKITTNFWLTVVGASLQKFFKKLLHKFTLANQTSPMARFLWCSLNCSPVKKYDTYGIIVLFADYKL